MHKNKCQPREGPFIFAALLFLVFTLCPQAQATHNLPFYYPKIVQTALDGNVDSQKLRRILFDVLSKAHLTQENAPDRIDDHCPSHSPLCYRHRPLNYRYARTRLFGELHLEGDRTRYFIKGVYCWRDHDRSKFPEGKPPAPGQIPSPNVINTEHTWPQSKFSRDFPKDLQKGDLHILYPVETRVNSIRSNHPFGNVSSVLNSPCPLAKKGYSGAGRLVFEPTNEHKGNVARAMFYFAVRYNLPIDPEQEDVLRRWARLDPVDESEKQRNNKIFEIQGNRNPFIDYPEFHIRITDF